MSKTPVVGPTDKLASGKPRRVIVISDIGPPMVNGFDALVAGGFEVVNRPDLHQVEDAERLVEALGGAWAVVAGGEPFTRSVFECLPELRVVARPGVGYDSVDVEAATDLGVLVFITPGLIQETLADFTLALMLAALRRIPVLDRWVRDGRWRPPLMGRDLYGSTVGVVGLGRIGQAVSRRLVAFGCKIVATEPRPDREFLERHAIELLPLDGLLAVADTVTLHVPLDDGTRQLLDASRIARMKPGAVLINTSRGAVLDEAALVRALRSGHLAGAGLDVFEREPLPPDHPLTQLDNVVLSGHLGSHTTTTLATMVGDTVSGLSVIAQGGLPVGAINPEVRGRPGWLEEHPPVRRGER